MHQGVVFDVIPLKSVADNHQRLLLLVKPKRVPAILAKVAHDL
jgi:hypothetical protein